MAIGYPLILCLYLQEQHLNQTGQAIEVIAMTMGVYPTLSLVNIRSNEHIQPQSSALVER